MSRHLQDMRLHSEITSCTSCKTPELLGHCIYHCIFKNSCMAPVLHAFKNSICRPSASSHLQDFPALLDCCKLSSTAFRILHQIPDLFNPVLDLHPHWHHGKILQGLVVLQALPPLQPSSMESSLQTAARNFAAKLQGSQLHSCMLHL